MNKLMLSLAILLLSIKGYSQSLIEHPFTKVEFSTSKQNNDAKMYVTGAFTSYLDGIVGDYAVNGKYYKGKEREKNKTFGTICILDSGRRIEIYSSKTQQTAPCYFHQICLLYNKVIQVKNNPNDYNTYRRAIGIKNGGKKYLVECENTTLYNFSKLLKSNNYKSAIYLDCGAWDYGWIKVNGKIKRLGHSDSDQSFTNYLYFW